jgi:hypothetical protein
VKGLSYFSEIINERVACFGSSVLISNLGLNLESFSSRIEK